MKICTATLKSLSPYSQSRLHDTPKKEREGADDYEQRTWKSKAHVTADGHVFIPPMALKQSVDAAAKFLSIQIPGKGKATYTKHFRSGLLVMDPVVLGTRIDDVQRDVINANSDGVRGSGKRVKRLFPTVPDWQGKAVFYIADETITEKVFAEVLTQCGQFIGIGRFRPENGGFYGRFEVVDMAWS